MDGIFNLNKPLGMTSHDVVARVRRLAHQRRVGHAGTLDPGASGVLLVCLGQATRVVEYLSESGKRYRATVILGMVTDTYDAEGEVIRSAPVHVTREELEATLPSFLGAQMQLPPRYSAIKVAGQPLYKLARAGVEVLLQPRPIEIYALDLIDWQPPALTLEVECSKGTYIRSLAYDLGEQLGCGAHLGGLVRLRSGPFTLDESLTLEELARALEDGTWQQYLYAPDEALLERHAVIVGPATEKRILLGHDMNYPPPAEIYLSISKESATDKPPLLDESKAEVEDEGEEAPGGDQTDLPLLRAYSSDGRFLAILRWHAPTHTWHPHKVLNSVPLEEQ